MPTEAGAEQYTWLDPPSQALTNGAYDVFVNTWWAVNESGQIALYRGSPQCNPNEHIARRVSKAIPGCVDVVQYVLVVLPHRCGS